MRLQAGTHLGPYEVLSSIGVGGMGEVYRARDTRLDRTVAIKVLAPELADDPGFRDRFTREAKVISALSHPHICALYDIGCEHESQYLVFELCRKGLAMFAVPASGTGNVTTLSDGTGGEDQAQVSPDGNCIAYNSKMSGEWEVYLAPLARMASATRVSGTGGVQPLWRGDGRELFYLTLDGTLMTVTARTASGCEADSPKPLFKTNLVPAEGWGQYAVRPDGQRFLIKEPVRQFFTLLQNWLPAQTESR
jgi:protein kinase-like protein